MKIALLAAASALLLSAGAASAAPAVAEAAVNLRAGPGTQYPVIGSIPSGATVDIAGCTGSWCQVDFAGETGFANRRYLAMAGEAGPAAGVATVPGYVYDDTPAYAYDDSYDYGYAYGPSFGVFVGAGGHRFHHRGNRDGRIGTWQGRPGWNGTGTGSWQGRTGVTGIPSVNTSPFGGRPSVSAPVGMSTGGGAVFRGGAGAAGGAQVGGGAAFHGGAAAAGGRSFAR